MNEGPNLISECLPSYSGILAISKRIQLAVEGMQEVWEILIFREGNRPVLFLNSKNTCPWVVSGNYLLDSLHIRKIITNIIISQANHHFCWAMWKSAMDARAQLGTETDASYFICQNYFCHVNKPLFLFQFFLLYLGTLSNCNCC